MKEKSISQMISNQVLGLSAVFWIVLLCNPGNIMSVMHCQIMNVVNCPATTDKPVAETFNKLLTINSVAERMLGWILMVLAMMLPKLISPIQYICDRSFKSRRLWSVILFVFGYITIWMITGFIMIILITELNFQIPNSDILAVMIGFIALLWQCSPLKQRYLNRGHQHNQLAAFGWEANYDVLLFGIMHGIWCVGSGWALMLFPMLLTKGHYLAMLFVTFIMISEHMEHPRLPRWYPDFRLKLLKIIIAQTKIRYKNLLNLSQKNNFSRGIFYNKSRVSDS